jgi:hypothetical protein
MNFDKQKPLTKKEIDYINSKENIGFINIPRYPSGNVHVKIVWALPISITRNEDPFYWYDSLKEESNKENYWVVYPDGDSEKSFEFQVKQFKDIDEALNYGLECYKYWLNCMMNVVNSIKI